MEFGEKTGNPTDPLLPIIIFMDKNPNPQKWSILAV